MLKYPKLALLCGTFVAAYILHSLGFFDRLESVLNGHGYWSMLLAGMLFSFGFTAAFGVAIIIDLAQQLDPIFGAMVGGLGAAPTDIGIFTLIRFAIFHEEILHLRETKVIRFLHDKLHHPNISDSFRKVILWSFAGIVIASPLPNEFGVTLVSSVTNVSSKEFIFLCFLLNATGILLILLGIRTLV